MRWTVLESGSSLGAFHRAAAARTAAELLDAFATGFAAPAQNMLVADRAGAIAVRSTGRFPVRPGDGSGLAARDGRSSANDWQGALPVARWPQAASPAQGFLASANQQPIDPQATRDYWGGSYDPWRALRINALLRADSSVTVDDMRRWQTDRGSERATLFVPHFLRAAERATARGGAGAAAVREAAGRLARWDRRYDPASTGATLFEGAMRQLADQTWDELARPARAGGDGRVRRVATPNGAVLAALLADPTSVWWDDRRTPAREDRDAVLAASLAAAHDQLVRDAGPPDAGGWAWGRRQHTNIHHLLRLPAFSRLGLAPAGGVGTLSPTAYDGTHGASWRMVVELGPEVRAWATYPGGQSGDPASPGTPTGSRGGSPASSTRCASRAAPPIWPPPPSRTRSPSRRSADRAPVALHPRRRRRGRDGPRHLARRLDGRARHGRRRRPRPRARAARRARAHARGLRAGRRRSPGAGSSPSPPRAGGSARSWRSSAGSRRPGAAVVALTLALPAVLAWATAAVMQGIAPPRAQRRSTPGRGPDAGGPRRGRPDYLIGARADQSPREPRDPRGRGATAAATP
jgi:hypothetical protein